MSSLVSHSVSRTRGDRKDRQVLYLRIDISKSKSCLQEVDDAMQYLEDLDRVYSVHVRPRFGKRSNFLQQVLLGSVPTF